MNDSLQDLPLYGARTGCGNGGSRDQEGDRTGGVLLCRTAPPEPRYCLRVASLIMSISALVLSVVSLGWQMWSWRRSGPVVKVTTGHAYPVYGGDVGDHYIYVQANNTGRAPVEVTGWSLQTLNGGSIVQVHPISLSSPLRHTLGPGAEASWFMRWDELDQRCGELGVRVKDLRAQVKLGNDVVVRARKRGIGGGRS